MAENKPGLSGTPFELRGVRDHQPSKSDRPVFGVLPERTRGKSKATPQTKTAPNPVNPPHVRPVFGEVPQRTSGYSATRANIESTVISSELVPTPQPETTKRKKLGVGDPLHLENPNILNFEEDDRGGRYHEAGFVNPGDYKITAIHDFEGKGKPVFSLERQLEDGHVSRVNIKPIGHGHGWERVQKE